VPDNVAVRHPARGRPAPPGEGDAGSFVRAHLNPKAVERLAHPVEISLHLPPHDLRGIREFLDRDASASDLAVINGDPVEERVVGADLHGAILSAVRSFAFTPSVSSAVV